MFIRGGNHSKVAKAVRSFQFPYVSVHTYHAFKANSKKISPPQKKIYIMGTVVYPLKPDMWCSIADHKLCHIHYFSCLIFSMHTLACSCTTCSPCSLDISYDDPFQLAAYFRNLHVVKYCRVLILTRINVLPSQVLWDR